MNQKTVVVADDEPVTRLDLSDMLRNLGFDLKDFAADGFDAIELCRKHRPDLVLMDIKMPVFDGLTATQTIVEEELAGCVVLLTAFSDPVFIQRATEIGAAGYLVKPIDEQRLLPAIKVAMAQADNLRRSREESRRTRQKMEDAKLVERAKVILARERGTGEGEAYRMIQKMAMDKRCSAAAVARALLSRDTRETVNRAKQRLIQTKGISEGAAYRYVEKLSQDLGGDMQEAARRILSQ